MPTATARTDAHSPVNMDPADYEYVFAFDSQQPGRLIGVDMDWWGGLMRDLRRSPMGEDRFTDQCHHCGARIRYVALLRHLPTGHIIAVGETCLDNRFSLESKADFDRLRKAAELDRAKQRIKTMAGEFLETLDGDLSIAFNRDVDVVAAFGLTQERDSYAIGVLVDMKAKLWDRYGALSDRQLAFAQKLLDEAVERRAKAEAIAAERATENRVMAPEGRQIVEGVIVARKFYEGDFSNYHKIGVKVEQGDGVWVLWVTEPNSVGETQRGDIIRMNVTVKRSAKDESFAWGSRPAKAEVIGNVGDECGGMDSLADPDEV